jgi:hypothetical protein
MQRAAHAAGENFTGFYYFTIGFMAAEKSPMQLLMTPRVASY